MKCMHAMILIHIYIVWGKNAYHFLTKLHNVSMKHKSQDLCFKNTWLDLSLRKMYIDMHLPKNKGGGEEERRRWSKADSLILLEPALIEVSCGWRTDNIKYSQNKRRHRVQKCPNPSHITSSTKYVQFPPIFNLAMGHLIFLLFQNFMETWFSSSQR